MLLPAPPLYPRKRKPRTPPPAKVAPVVTGPVLVSATFEGNVLTLAFDRAIDAAGLVPEQLVILDGPSLVEWVGTIAFEQPTPQSIAVTMIENAEFTGEGVTLNASGGAGIVSTDDATPWAGVTGLELPFAE
jgi:hypothetical protein